MKKRCVGIFGKTFIYTLTFIFLVLMIAVVLLANQFVQFYATVKDNQIAETVQSFVEQLNGKSKEEAVKIAGDFADKYPIALLSVRLFWRDPLHQNCRFTYLYFKFACLSN